MIKISHNRWLKSDFINLIISKIYKKESVCTIDDFKKKRRKMINFIAIGVIGAILAYFFWLYVIVELLGILLGIWS